MQFPIHNVPGADLIIQSEGETVAMLMLSVTGQRMAQYNLTPKDARGAAEALGYIAGLIDDQPPENEALALINQELDRLIAHFGLDRATIYGGDDAPLVALTNAIIAHSVKSEKQYASMAVEIEVMNRDGSVMLTGDENLHALQHLTVAYQQEFGAANYFGMPDTFLEFFALSMTEAAARLMGAMRGLSLSGIPAKRNGDDGDHMAAWVKYAGEHGGGDAVIALLQIAYMAFEWQIDFHDVALTLLSMTPEANDHEGDSGDWLAPPPDLNAYLAEHGTLAAGVYKIPGGTVDLRPVENQSYDEVINGVAYREGHAVGLVPMPDDTPASLASRLADLLRGQFINQPGQPDVAPYELPNLHLAWRTDPDRAESIEGWPGQRGVLPVDKDD